MISRRQFLRGKFASPAVQAGAITIAASCLAYANIVCRSCGEACEPGAIRFRPRLGGAALPEVDAARCNGCGLCVAPCPAGAITLT